MQFATSILLSVAASLCIAGATLPAETQSQTIAIAESQNQQYINGALRKLAEESQFAEAVDEIVNDIDTTNQKLAEIELSLIPRSKPSTTLRQQAPKAVKIFFASIFVITSYLYLLGVTEKFDLNMPAIGNCLSKHYHQQANCIFPERRQVINGIMCDVQRKQINVFMASFFGGFFAADQWYAVKQQPHLNH